LKDDAGELIRHDLSSQISKIVQNGGISDGTLRGAH